MEKMSGCRDRGIDGFYAVVKPTTSMRQGSSMEKTKNPTAKRVVLQSENCNMVVLPCPSPLRYMTDLVRAHSAVTLFAHFCSSLVPPFVVAALCHLHKFPNLALFNLDLNATPNNDHLAATIMATTHATEKAQQTCPRCTEPATKQCGGCKSIAYWSLECQQADWPVHKNLCKSFKDFSGPRPSPDMRRVVVLHPNEKKPRFMWASLTDDDWGLGTGRVCPADTLDYHSKDIVWRVRETRKNIWTGQDLGYASGVVRRQLVLQLQRHQSRCACYDPGSGSTRMERSDRGDLSESCSRQY
jgi:hypothetical protein